MLLRRLAIPHRAKNPFLSPPCGILSPPCGILRTIPATLSQVLALLLTQYQHLIIQGTPIWKARPLIEWRAQIMYKIIERGSESFGSIMPAPVAPARRAAVRRQTFRPDRWCSVRAVLPTSMTSPECAPPSRSLLLVHRAHRRRGHRSALFEAQVDSKQQGRVQRVKNTESASSSSSRSASSLSNGCNSVVHLRFETS